jgi:DNA-binding NtrC family response regulator
MANSQSSVLVLDADEATRALYERALADRWRMLGSASESDALALLDGQRIDALVVEPATLKDEGWDFLARIRRSRPALPIVVCSTLDARRKGARQGVSAYLIKPVSPQQLADVLREVLAVAPSTESSER